MDTTEFEILNKAVAEARAAREHYMADVEKYNHKLSTMEGDTMSQVEHEKDDKAPATGVIGTILGAVGTAGVLNNGNGLGGILGGGNSQLADAK